MGHFKKFLFKILIGSIGLFLLAVIFGLGTVIVFSMGLPKIASLADYRPNIPSRILSKDGTVLAEIALENREVTQFDEVPQLIIDAFLSAEDSSFFDHAGVDYMGVLRAFLANLRAGRVVQGGSTITQQVAKSFLLTQKRSYSRKIKDILLARKIEKRFSKKEILYLYLNQVYLGGGYYGIKAAFHGYFGKELDEASIAEAAMVAGLLVAPGRYSPYINPERASFRQRYVLARLYNNGVISREEYREALKEKIHFRLWKSRKFKAGHFTDWVRRMVIERIGEDELKTGGYSIQTYLDWELQQTAEKAVLKGVREIDKRQGFKGPIGFIESSKMEEWVSNERIGFYRNQSNYFTIGENFERIYEISFEEEELESARKQVEDFRKVVKSLKWRAGYSKNDVVLQYLKKNKLYRAVVEYVDNSARLIYVNLLGIKGVIPYEKFRWARKREISEKRKDFHYITRPSSIVKKGDLVWVQIENLKANISKVAHGNYSTTLKKLSFRNRKLVRTQMFLELSLEQDVEVQAALVSLNPFNGEVLSFVGGVDFDKSQFNRALQSHRQPGSCFKPILFAAALENGYTPASIIIDSPETLGSGVASLNWKPRNYDGKFQGPITFRNSLEKSRNVPTIKMAHKMGIPLILDYTKRIGLKAELDRDLSLALGSFGVTLMNLTSTYAIFPNGGKKITPKFILSIIDRNGIEIPLEENKNSDEDTPAMEDELTRIGASDEEVNELSEASLSEEKKDNQFLKNLEGDQIYDPRLAYIMTNLLRGVVLHGTGRKARELSLFLGGKTGTTNDYVDAWFVGFSARLATGVWTGFDENQSLGWGESGAKSALPIWKDFMRHGLKKFGEYAFRPPTGIVNVKIDKETGKLANGGQKEFEEAFVEGTEPGTEPEIPAFIEEGADVDSDLFEEDEYYSP